MGSFALIGLVVACVVAGVRAAKHKDFVYAEGTKLMINDRSFYYAGSNTYYLFYAQPQDIDSLFAAANSIDAKVIRTWLWADGLTDGVSYAGETVYYQNYNTTTKKIEYNDNSLTGLGRMDYIIESAKKHGVKLILTLTNNWNAFGGMDWYVQNFNGTYHDQFYTEPVIKKWYKDWVSHALHRVNAISGVPYIDEPTIMLWEIANEPRCVGSGEFPASPSCNTTTITKWIKEMSAHVKSIDHKHLVAIGDEGFFGNGPVFPGAYSNIYDGSAGMDFDANLQIDTIDVGTFHMYFDYWMPNFSDPQFNINCLNWIETHADAMRKYKKPVILEEFGVRNKTQRLIDQPTWNKKIEKENISGDNYWMLPSEFYGSLYPDYDGFSIYANDTHIDILVIDHAHAMDAKNHKKW